MSQPQTFGVPSYLVNGQLSWGADANDFVKAYLADPGVLGNDEMQRVSALTVGAWRMDANWG